MDIQLTKDADYFICSIYKEYLSKVKNRISKEQAKHFLKDDIPDLIPKINICDIGDIKEELKSKGLILKNVLSNIELTDDGIIYMEQRFSNKVDKIIDYLSKLKP